MERRPIVLKGVRVHNLKGVDLQIEPDTLTVFTGVSGSGKSSLAFDTLYVEGQRRYIESLTTYARRQIGDMAKPDFESATGISPTISIEQKTAGKNPRSTVGTLTEIYDFIRVLFARVGVPHCPISGEAVESQSKERIIKTVQTLLGRRLMLLAPIAKEKKGEFRDEFADLLKKGFMRARVDGNSVNLGEEIALDGSVAHDVEVVIDRVVVNEESFSRIAEAVMLGLEMGNGVLITLDADTGEEKLFSTHAFSPKSGLSYSSLEPQDFSFNSPAGSCPTCSGLGYVQDFDLDLVINENLSIAKDCCLVGSSYQTVRFGNIYDNLARIYDFSVKTPWKKLSKRAKQVFLYGTEKKWTKMHFVHPVTGSEWDDVVRWRGVLHEAKQRLADAKSDSYQKKMHKLMHEQVCPACKGEKLKPYPAATVLGGKRIAELTGMTINQCAGFFDQLKLSEQEQLIAEELLKEIQERLKFLLEVGLHYLTLDRSAPTLSGGEAQRVRLASQIGCGLVGITYILDEPSIGLHPRDNLRLIHTLEHLRNRGNTVVVVEHDEETIHHADRVVDFGPRAGHKGGEILVNGSLDELFSCEKSLTGAYLSGKKKIPIPKKRRKPQKEKIEVVGATHHNLKSINVKVPLGVFLAVTGVSGSGKSSFVTDTLYPALANKLMKAEHKVGKFKSLKGTKAIDKVIAIDQSPIGRNPRSNPATYIKLFDEIRDLFTQLPEAKARGYQVGRFSFNVKEGSCPICLGTGQIKIDMDFLEDAFETCPECQGRRFDNETLSVYFKGKNIYDVLEMEVIEALEHFKAIPSIKNKLETLVNVGMDYIKLGQSSTTLSGGEAQRIKLAKELSRPATGKTLYILDEPTTGLHFHDIKHLLEVLHRLVDQGNTVLVIEHNMDVVKTADWILDIGPEGGEGGGELIASTTPEKIAKIDTPTGLAVKQALEGSFLHEKKERKREKPLQEILIEGAEENNLKSINALIPRNQITIFTGPSGSGKSSLAFDTIFAEGQRRYTDSLSSYARQFVKQSPKPKVAKVEGLSPAIAIEQKAHAGNPRSTVGTLTEIYDFLRVLFAVEGIPHCPETGEKIRSISKEFVLERVLELPEGEKVQILAPIELKKTESFSDLQKQGFLRIRLNGEYYSFEDDIPFDRKRKNALFLVIDRLKISKTIRARLFESIELAAKFGKNQLVIAKENEDISFNLAFAVESTGKSYPAITPHTFAFNKPEGMCPDCMGIGMQYGANWEKNRSVLLETPLSLMRTIWQEVLDPDAFDPLIAFLEEEGIDPFTQIDELKKDKLNLFMNGSKKQIKTPQGFHVRWRGINPTLTQLAKTAHSNIKQALLPHLDAHTCPSCNGGRLNPLASHVTINDLSISDFCSLPIDEATAFIKKLSKGKKVLEEVFSQIENRLAFLLEVGLGYISLNRPAPSLSGGETQRIRLARQLGSSLRGCLYVLDEPTIGLHPQDNERLNTALHKLKELGNTLLLVEHDPQTIETADKVMDFGPGAGEKGGHITAQGTLLELMENENSLTGAYLKGTKKIHIPSRRRPTIHPGLEIKKANLHNLKNLSLKIPSQVLTCITGVSGSGKSTLMQQIILPALKLGILREDQIGKVSGISNFDRLISIDQNPLGHTIRSNVGTYTDVLSRMREFFSQLPEAKVKGLQPKHFSSNHRRGMCTHCWGMGYKKIEMFFLPPVTVKCEECQGLRLNPVSLGVLYKGKNFGEYLSFTIQQARQIFEDHPRIVRILDTLIDVGLGYLKLGQETVTLSGGEAQRIKLSRELSKRSTGKTLYLLDEPTTGLHSEDIHVLLKVLHKLVDKGNTMVIIEHNLDMVKNADHVIDLGPGPGVLGGKIVASGTPEQIAKCKKSITGRYLQKF
jgi:excinuclease ABC subunit A